MFKLEIEMFTSVTCSVIVNKENQNIYVINLTTHFIFFTLYDKR
jgi:hypothetical protein